MSVKRFLSVLLGTLLAGVAFAVTLPSESYEDHTYTVQSAPPLRGTAPVIDYSTCAEMDEFDQADARAACCEGIEELCLDGGTAEDCAELYSQCIGSSTPLPLEGGDWALLLMVAAFAAYQYNKTRVCLHRA